MMLISSDDLKLEDIPDQGASDLVIIRFAQTLNGYEQVGGDAASLGVYLKELEKHPVASLPLNDLRILLFARQRAHYHQGGGWQDGDPLMDEMRALVQVIRSRVENAK